MRGRKLRIDREFVRRSVSARNRHLAGYEFIFFRIANLGERERALIERIDTVGARSRGALGKETDAIRGIRGKRIGRKRNRRFAVDRRSRSFKDKFVRAVVDNNTRPHGINRTDCRLGRVRAIAVVRQCELGKLWCAGKAKLDDVACRTRERKFVDLEISALRLIAASCEVEQIRRARAGIVNELRFYRTIRFKRRIVICSVLNNCIYKLFSVRSRIAVDAQVAKKRRAGRVIHQVVGAHVIRRKRIFRTHDEERNLVRTARNAPNRKTGRTGRLSIAVANRTILRGGGQANTRNECRFVRNLSIGALNRKSTQCLGIGIHQKAKMRALVGLDGVDDIGRQGLVLPALVSGSRIESTGRALADVGGRRQVGKRCRERKPGREAVDDAGRILPVFGIEPKNRTGCKLRRRLRFAF